MAQYPKIESIASTGSILLGILEVQASMQHGEGQRHCTGRTEWNPQTGVSETEASHYIWTPGYASNLDEDVVNNNETSPRHRNVPDCS